MALVRAVVGGKVSAAPINAIIDQVEEIGRHAEFTATSASVATATGAAVGTLLIDATKSNNTTFVTAGVSSVTLVDEGVYSVDAVGSLPASPTGNTFIRVSVNGAPQEGYAYGNAASAAWGSSLVSSLYATAGTVLTFSWFHTSAASRVLTSRYKVTRIA